LANIHLAKTQLGYDPKITIEEGLKKTFDWFKKAYLVTKEN